MMAVKLIHDDKGDVSAIFAPDINKNTTLGVGGDFRYLGYPSTDTHYFVVAGASVTKARSVDLSYATGLTRAKWWSWSGHLFWEHDPSERFYGVGNTSTMGNQSNYTTKQFYFESVAGINLSEQAQVAWVMRPRYVRIGPGGFNSVPFIGQVFPKVKGLDGGSEFYNSIVASLDTRDSTDLPHHGGYYALYAGAADRALGSSVSYTRFGTEVRHYFPIGDRVVVASHAYVSYIPAGNETPFWAMGRLGGEHTDYLLNSATNRGYGTARWSDNNVEGFDAEFRTHVLDAKIFNTQGSLELAPFADVGKVSHSADANPINRMHPSGGLGIRAVAEPYIVGYVDMGWGSAGTSIFAGVNYPF
jgi:outer membrane protein assembly factor BamA